MRKNLVTTKAPAEQVVKDIRRATRKKCRQMIGQMAGPTPKFFHVDRPPWTIDYNGQIVHI